MADIIKLLSNRGAFKTSMTLATVSWRWWVSSGGLTMDVMIPSANAWSCLNNLSNQLSHAHLCAHVSYILISACVHAATGAVRW